MRRGARRTLSFFAALCMPAIVLASSCTSDDGASGGEEAGTETGASDGKADVSPPDDTSTPGEDARADAPHDALTDAADDAIADATTDAADDALADASDDAAIDAGTDAPVDAPSDVDAGNPLCDVPAADFEPALLCGQRLSVTVACTHKVTQINMPGSTCCTPKNPGVECDGSDMFCCAAGSPGVYCGDVSSSNEAIPIDLVLTRDSRPGKNTPVPFLNRICVRSNQSTTKVSVIETGPATPSAGIALALRLYERWGCNDASYNAVFFRTDATSSYAGRWRDHPVASQNRDSSGEATVTLNANATITYASKGSVLVDRGANGPTWSRRTYAGECNLTFAP